MDEVVMAEIQKSQGEYKPLAKVEELEEANYNMIDNVLNNMPPKKEPYLEYFAAECDEFHDMGAYEKSTDVNQIAAVYEKYRENPKTAYLGCSMGIIYRDPEDSYYDETASLERSCWVCPVTEWKFWSRKRCLPMRRHSGRAAPRR